MKRSFTVPLGIAILALIACLGLTNAGADASGGWYSCSSGVYNPTTGTCPDGGIPEFHPDMVKAAPPPKMIQAFVPRLVRPLTDAEMKALDAQLQRQADALAKKWSRNGRLNAAQIRQLQNETCFLVAAKNPDLTCVLQP